MKTIEELQKRVERLEEQLEGYAWTVSPAMAQAKIDELNEELDYARTALAFYADPQTYGIGGGSIERVIQDAGLRARTALKGT